MRSVFCFEMFHGPPRIVFGMREIRKGFKPWFGRPVFREGFFDRRGQILSATGRLPVRFATIRFLQTTFRNKKGSVFVHDPIKKIDRQYPHDLVSHLNESVFGHTRTCGRGILAASAAEPQLRKRSVFLYRVHIHVSQEIFSRPPRNEARTPWFRPHFFFPHLCGLVAAGWTTAVEAVLKGRSASRKIVAPS